MPARPRVRRDVGQEVELRFVRTRLEPNEVEMRDRLGDGLLLEAEQLAVERANVVLPTLRVGQRDVLEPAHRR